MTPAPANPLGVGLHYGVPASTYHGDPCETPSLSSSVARTLLSRSPAAAYREHARLGGKRKETTEAMNTGSIVHSLLAENQSDFEIGLYDNYRSKPAQQWRDAVIASGKNAVLECDLDDSRKIAASIRKNVCNGGITNDPFAPHGKSEVTIIWKEGNVYCRALPDRLVVDPNGYADMWDWKITNDVSDDAISRSITKFSYHFQEGFYRRGFSAVMPAYAHRISWTFVFALNVEPYTVRRVCLSDEYRGIANADVGRAIRLWQHAMAKNEWPDGSEQTLKLEPPAWLYDDEISDSIST